eukprot:m.108764 g.108764  ORF g.108764 m.108764 type:complete len:1183 (+) comp12821_c0_seq1:234-3782(+)
MSAAEVVEHAPSEPDGSVKAVAEAAEHRQSPLNVKDSPDTHEDVNGDDGWEQSRVPSGGESPTESAGQEAVFSSKSSAKSLFVNKPPATGGLFEKKPMFGKSTSSSSESAVFKNRPSDTPLFTNKAPTAGGSGSLFENKASSKPLFAKKEPAAGLGFFQKKASSKPLFTNKQAPPSEKSLFQSKASNKSPFAKKESAAGSGPFQKKASSKPLFEKKPSDAEGGLFKKSPSTGGSSLFQTKNNLKGKPVFGKKSFGPSKFKPKPTGARLAFVTEECHKMYDGELPITAERLAAAAATSPASLCALGYAKCFGLFGMGDIDEAGAVECYTRAADQEYARAYSLLSSCHRNGIGVEVDVAEADRLRLTAAELGDGREMFNLGLAYSTGERCLQSDAQAAEWFRRGVEVGDVSCMVNLGIMHEKGTGVQQNWAEAFRLYKLAALSDSDRRGSAVAANNLANCYTQGWGTEVDLPEAARWLLRAASLGDCAAAFQLGSRYETGHGIPVDWPAAFSFYKIAAALGDPRATFNAANCLKHGWGTDVNPEAAWMLYIIAAQGGVPRARVQVDSISSDPTWRRLRDGEVAAGAEVDLKAQRARDNRALDAIHRKAFEFQGPDGLDIEGLINHTLGLSPLCAAARDGDLDRVSELVQAAGDDGSLTAPDRLGNTPVHHAAAKGHLAVLEYLVNATHPSVTTPNVAGATPLSLACQGQHGAVVEWLVTAQHAYHAEIPFARWSLLKLVVENGVVETVQLLLAACSEIAANAPDNANDDNADGDDNKNEFVDDFEEPAVTALRIAAEKGHLAIVQHVVEEWQVDVETRDLLGNTALMLAAIKGRSDVVRYLVEEAGASASASKDGAVGPTALLTASAKGHVEVVRLLAPRCNPALADGGGFTPVHHAARSGNPSVLRVLAACDGVDVNVLGGPEDSRGTALHHAAVFGRVETVRVLLNELNANVNAVDDDNNTPTTVAYQAGHHDVVTLLVECGGQPAALANANPAVDLAQKYMARMLPNLILHIEREFVQAGDEAGRSPKVYRQLAQEVVIHTYNELYLKILPLGWDDDIGIFSHFRFHGPRCVCKAFVSAGIALLPREALTIPGEEVDFEALKRQLEELFAVAVTKIHDWGCLSQAGHCRDLLLADVRTDWQQSGCPRTALFEPNPLTQELKAAIAAVGAQLADVEAEIEDQ